MNDPTPRHRVSVVMLAFGVEEYLHEAAEAVLASTGVDIELVLVDNGASPASLAKVPVDDRVTVLRPRTNLGFTGGVNLGAAHVSYETIALVNSDAIVDPSALDALARHLDDPEIGIAGATILLADDPTLINSAGNPLHVLGLSWAGEMHRPASSISQVREVAAASGACLAIRRAQWEALGGFPEDFFAYVEDMELSWRCWQHGLRVEVLPQARAIHHYEFSRARQKMYLIERNRLLFLATVHERRTLALLSIPLLCFELAILAVAARQGWSGQKVKGWHWILTHLKQVRERRAFVQTTRIVPDARLAHLITDSFDPAQVSMPRTAAVLQSMLRIYWRGVCRSIQRRDSV